MFRLLARRQINRSFSFSVARWNKPHTHTHGGKPCSGHSHTHNQEAVTAAHTHTHGGKPCSGHSHSHNNGLTDSAGETTRDKSAKVQGAQPMLLLAFTCSPCSTRSTHMLSKQAYNHGTVLVQCTGCKVRHLIADHLGIFSDNKVTLKDIMAGKGEGIKQGTLESGLMDGDLIWEEVPEHIREVLKDRIDAKAKAEEIDDGEVKKLN